MFILAQICGVIALILTVISVQFKTKEKIVMCFIWANIVVAIQYFLLEAITGAIISIINAIRCIVFYFYKKKDKTPSIIVLIIFEIVAIISGIISWQNIWSLLPIIVTVIYTYGLWQDDITIVRITTGIAGFGWTIYNIVVRAYIGALQEIAQLISSIISLYRNKEKKC
ncbi:MAG: YgjV family protein [Clostridia bacterium]|nr:YgjV family protein [Clostridia bacterium]